MRTITSNKYIGIDLGNSSGRIFIADYNGEKIHTEEIHRFENRPVFLNDKFYWDFLRLFSEIKNGISMILTEHKRDIKSVSIDAWGNDFGMIDKKGELVSNPIGCRGNRTKGMLKEVSKIIPMEDLFMITGEGSVVKSGLNVGCFPAIYVKPDNGIDNLEKLANAQHFSIVYRDISKEISLFNSLLKIETLNY